MSLADNALCTVGQCKWKSSVSATTSQVEDKINAASDWIEIMQIESLFPILMKKK